MFNLFKRPIAPPLLRHRCRCSEEFEPNLDQLATEGCPKCGRRVPVAISENGEPWVIYPAYRIRELRDALSRASCASHLNSEDRSRAMQQIEEEIRRLSDGTWVNAIRQSLVDTQEHFRKMTPEEWSKFAKNLGSDTELCRKLARDEIQKLKEELELAEALP